MRVISPKKIKDAMLLYSQWKVGLKLWLDVFNRSELRFESYAQLKLLWKKTSGWNMDRIPARHLRENSRKGALDIYIFDIKKNQCRIITWLNPHDGTLYIKDVLSHTEYDKWWKSQIH